MKQKIFTTIPILLTMLVFAISVNAQPYGDRHNRRYDDRGRHGRHDNRYDDRRYDNRDRRGYARYDVRDRPVAPRYVQPRRPSRVHVWIDGGWIWNRGQYVFQAGYWSAPRPREVWVQGRWDRSPGGWYWVDGYWAANSCRW
jgi:hypothetical protein